MNRGQFLLGLGVLENVSGGYISEYEGFDKEAPKEVESRIFLVSVTSRTARIFMLSTIIVSVSAISYSVYTRIGILCIEE